MTIATDTPRADHRWPDSYTQAYDEMVAGDGAVALGGYPAKKCARATHNRFDPTVPPEAQASLALQTRFENGRVFETEIVAMLADRLGKDMVTAPKELTDEGSLPYRERELRLVRWTLDAMSAGARVIVGGQLPTAQGRVGLPDLLLRVTDDTEPARYVPGDIKWHSTFEKKHGPRRKHEASSLLSPAHVVTVAGYSVLGKYRKDDGMQLAHYTRMLQALGAHPGKDWLRGFILGRSDYAGLIPGAEHETVGLTWHHLGDPFIKVWAKPDRDESTGLPTSATEVLCLLDHYDREFGFRHQVAEVAARQGQPGAPLPLVFPVGKSDCHDCGYRDWCRDNARPEDAASWAVTAGPLSDREWAFLNDQGMGTIEGLAQAPVGLPGSPDADPVFMAGHAASAASLNTPAKRIIEAVQRARMHRDGVLLDWHASDDALAGITRDLAPRDIEIDFDIEWDPEGHIYLWGFEVRESAAAQVLRRGPREDGRAWPEKPFYMPVHDLNSAEPKSAEEMVARVIRLVTRHIERVEEAGLSLGIYHWSPAETSQSRRVSLDLPDLMKPYLVDLHKTVKAAFFPRDGLSVKTVAPAFGFEWRQDDAGGDVSQIKYALVRSGTVEERAAAREWLLDYNADDCRATAVIRRRMRRHTPGTPVLESESHHRLAALRANRERCQQMAGRAVGNGSR